MYEAGHPKPVLYDSLEGQGGKGGRRGVQDGGDTSVSMAHSILMHGKNHHNTVK